MTTAIVKQELTVNTWQMIQQIAPFAKDSRLFGVATQQQAAMVMLKGFELGMSLTASFENIYIIGDKPSLSPRGALALVLSSSEYAGMKIEDQVDSEGKPSACSVWMKRKNGLEYTARFTMEDAKRAELIKPGSGWVKYPANMLRYRALGYAIDIVFPDLQGGMKRSDELGADLTPEGDVIEIEGSWSRVPQSKPVTTVTEQDRKDVESKVTLQDLINRHGAEKVLEANNGQIPSTEGDILEVMVKLEAGLLEL